MPEISGFVSKSRKNLPLYPAESPPPPYDSVVKDEPTDEGVQQLDEECDQPPQHPYYLEEPPPDYLCASILACLCCCWCLGIVAIVKSFNSRVAMSYGDQEKAERYSREAKAYIYSSIGVGILVIILNIIIRKYSY